MWSLFRRILPQRAAMQAAIHHHHGGLVHSRTLGEPSITVRTRLMLHWAQIALAQEREAHAARAELERRREQAPQTGIGFDPALELHPSMLAVTAAATAIDALYGEVKDAGPSSQVTRDRRCEKRLPRYTHILETLKQGFPVKNEWHGELKWLFHDLRDAALHPSTSFAVPKQHPLGVNVAPEYVAYACESATRAVDLMLDVLVTCAERPRPPLEAWSADARQPIKNLVEARGASTPF